ncbi:MAG: sensor histidine kinase [Alphaproteobacteria bacterium]|nr:sensor histidine kinase [Alphaproteobacteria bacterium]
MDNKLKSLIEHKEKLFWSLQVLGWIAYCAARTLNAYALGEKTEFIYAVAMGGIGGFWITIGLRHIYQFLRRAGLSPLMLLGSVIICIGISSMLFSFVEVWSMNQLYDPDWTTEGLGFFYRTLYDTFVLMTWSGLYFVINFHFQLQRQKEMYLAASAQAHQAQLKMLRYQLNPHFLFNTLNAISTLVLDRQTKNANSMLIKLSAFLRFTLINQPLQKTTLEEELYALTLYLDIERVRFQDRLKIIIDVSEEAKTALIPSLLLQPLIENSIKYAVTPQIEGGTIAIKAAIKDDKLNIMLADNGPGFDDCDSAKSNPQSSGVGIANTRERLNKLYPVDGNFEIFSHRDYGVTITITLPCEFSDKNTSDKRKDAAAE